jgi:hypothetical protein
MIQIKSFLETEWSYGQEMFLFEISINFKFEQTVNFIFYTLEM